MKFGGLFSKQTPKGSLFYKPHAGMFEKGLSEPVLTSDDARCWLLDATVRFTDYQVSSIRHPVSSI
jgi:hypothetical protein